MKKIFFIIAIALSFSFMACERGSNDGSQEAVSTSQTDGQEAIVTDTLPDDSVTKTSLESLKTTDLLDSINSLKTELNEKNDEIISLQENIKDKASLQMLFIVVGVVAFILLGVIYILYSNLRNKYHNLKSKVKNSENIIPQHIHRDVEECLNKHQKRLDDLEREVKYGPLRYDVGTGSQTEVPKSADKVDVVGQPVKSVKVFYMPRTIQECMFQDSKKKTSKDNTTYFKFTTLKHNTTKAEFIFDPYDKLALTKSFDDRDGSVATVCEIEVACETPNSYENDGCGEAELKDGIWKVTKKLKLRYV